MACWGKAANATSYSPLISFRSTTGGHFFARISFRGDVGGDPVEAVVSDGGGASVANSAGSFTANVWTHIAGVFASTSSRTVYLNGTSTSNGATRTPNTPDEVFIARADTSYGAADVAEAGIWNVALTDSEIASLARGVSPRDIRPGSLVSYWRLMGRSSPEPDFVGRYDLTLFNTPTQAAHPRIVRHGGGRVVVPVSAPASSNHNKLISKKMRGKLLGKVV